MSKTKPDENVIPVDRHRPGHGTEDSSSEQQHKQPRHENREHDQKINPQRIGMNQAAHEFGKIQMQVPNAVEKLVTLKPRTSIEDGLPIW